MDLRELIKSNLAKRRKPGQNEETLKSFSARCKISRQTLYLIMAGKYRASDAIIDRISKALRVKRYRVVRAVNNSARAAQGTQAQP